MEFEYHYNGIAQVITWDPNKIICIGERSTSRSVHHTHTVGISQIDSPLPQVYTIPSWDQVR